VGDGTASNDEEAPGGVVEESPRVTDLRWQAVAYASALGATTRAVQPSLTDFLR